MRRRQGEFNRLPVELEGGATPGWWTSSCFAQVRAAYTPAGQDSPPGVVFLLAQPKARQVNGNLKIEGAKAPSTSCDCGPARWYHSRERGCRRTIRKRQPQTKFWGLRRRLEVLRLRYVTRLALTWDRARLDSQP